MKVSAQLLFVVASLALVAAPATPAAGNNQEISAGGLVFMAQDRLFNTGEGGVLTYRYWLSSDWALTASLGATHTTVKDAYDRFINSPAGSFDFIPLGADLTCNIVDLDPVRLNVNLGLRYAFINSSATCRDPLAETKTVDMTLDNVFLGQLGLDADYALSKHWALFAAANYQQDFNKNKLQTPTAPLRSAEVSAFNVGLGLRYNF